MAALRVMFWRPVSSPWKAEPSSRIDATEPESRTSAEVGAVILVGGNIAHATRVMTTAIALETAKGELALALGLGIVLLGISLAVNGAAYVINEIAQAREAEAAA